MGNFYDTDYEYNRMRRIEKKKEFIKSLQDCKKCNNAVYSNVLNKISKKLNDTMTSSFYYSNDVELTARKELLELCNASAADTFYYYFRYKYILTYGELYYLENPENMNIPIPDGSIVYPAEPLDELPDMFMNYSTYKTVSFSGFHNDFIDNSRELDKKLEKENAFIKKFNDKKRKEFKTLRIILGLDKDKYFCTCMLTFAEMEAIIKGGLNIFNNNFYEDHVIIRDRRLEDYSKGIINYNNKIRTMYKTFREDVGLDCKIYKMINNGKVKNVVNKYA